MQENAQPWHLSAWDTTHFGVRVGKLYPATPADVATALAWARSHELDLLIARTATEQSQVVYALEQAGFRLMDTLVRYTFALDRTPIPADSSGITVRLAQPTDIPAIGAIAQATFRGYRGHFHQDQRLDRARCDDLYTQWAMNSCREEALADAVLLAVDAQDTPLGFATQKQHSAEAAEGVLYGVAPAAQGRGIYRLLLIHGLRWSAAQRVAHMEVSSQVHHYAVQRVWQRLGFEIFASGYTFHLWLDTLK